MPEAQFPGTTFLGISMNSRNHYSNYNHFYGAYLAASLS